MYSKRKKFFVIGLPRSRTAWLSEFLSTPSCKVGHDVCCNFSSVTDLLNSDYDGFCDTGLGLIHDKLIGKIVVVVRNYDDCLKSLLSIGIPETNSMRKLGYSINAAKLLYPSVSYDDLNNESTCQWLFEYLTEEVFDVAMWKSMKSVNIQVNVESEFARFKENANNLKSMFGESLC
jgi:hypothetical protein